MWPTVKVDVSMSWLGLLSVVIFRTIDVGQIVISQLQGPGFDPEPRVIGCLGYFFLECSTAFNIAINDNNNDFIFNK